MFKNAYEGKYAIGAFNVNNLEIIQGITEAAAELRAPLILQVSAGARKYAKHVYLMKLIEAAEIDTGLPICVHLDHGEVARGVGPDHPRQVDIAVVMIRKALPSNYLAILVFPNP